MYGSGWRSFVRYDEDKDRAKLSRTLLQRVAGYAVPYKGRIAVMLATILVISALGAIPPLLVRRVLDVTLPQRDFAELNWLAIGMIGLPIASGLLTVLQRYLSSQVGEGVIYDLRRALYEHLQRMSLRFFTNTHAGELMSRLNNDVVGSQRALTGTLIDITSNSVTLAITLFVMLALDWRLTLIAIAILPLFVLPARRVAVILRDVVRRQMVLNAEMNAMMNETLNVSGALLVKIFGRTPEEQERFSERARLVRDIGIRQALIGRWFFLGLSLTGAAGMALVVWVGGLLVLTQPGFTTGTLVAFTIYLGQLYGPITALSNARVEFATSMVSFERVFEVIDLPIEIKEKPGARPLGEVTGRVSFEDVSFSYVPGDGGPEQAVAVLSQVERPGQTPRAALSLADRREEGAGSREQGAGGRERGPGARLEADSGGVNSAPRATLVAGNGKAAAEAEGQLPGSRLPSPESRLPSPVSRLPSPEARYALRNVSFTVAPGQLAALVGPSGAGKTTITYLLPRLYDPTSGRIAVDGVDIRDVTLDSLASQIGMVTQESYLFHDTIRANLLYARPGANDAELQTAAKAANIHDFIMSLPEGYDTIVGERGYRLSGGEKQRIAIARVLLKDPRILVLDEATSALDSQSEALIQAALERLMVGRTSIVIAHRLSTVLAADLILVMEQGRVVEQGTHAELLARSGVYATLYRTQFRHLFEDEEEVVSAQS